MIGKDGCLKNRLFAVKLGVSFSSYPNIDHLIDQIEISSFKSIRHLKLTGFKRINLLLERPNVGKSNLLEALSLFSLPYVWEGSKKLTDLVRLEESLEIFGMETIPALV